MALVNISANGYGCIPVLLMIWYESSSIEFFLPLSRQVLMLRQKPLRELTLINVPWSLEFSDGPKSRTWLS